MRQGVELANQLDADGNPSGGYVSGTGLRIDWQDGPLGRDADRQEPNGAFVEDVIYACVERIRFYNTTSEGKFACRQNSLAITKLEEALMWLDNRTRERESRGVEGTHIP